MLTVIKGSVGRVLDRGGAVFNARAFGALGDGVTDAQPALADACAAAAVDGGVVVVPAGTYMLGATLEIPANVKLEGVGSASSGTILKRAAALAGGNVVKLAGFGARIASVRIDADDLNGALLTVGLDVADYKNFLTVENVHIRNAYRGLYLHGVAPGLFYNSFRDVWIWDCVYGLDADGTDAGSIVSATLFANLQINGANVTRNAGAGTPLGIRLAGTTGLTFVSGAVEQCYNGVQLVSGDGNVFDGTWLEGHDNMHLIIADNPAVRSFHFKGIFDETKVQHTPSDNRTVILENGQFSLWSGRALGQVNGAGALAVLQSFNLDRCLLRGVGNNETGVSAGATISVWDTSVLYLNYAGAQAITDLTSPMEGQVVTLIAGNGNATIANGGNFHLSANWTPTQYDTLTLVYSPTLLAWIEVSRSTNT